jgi:hypothetical protein
MTNKNKIKQKMAQVLFENDAFNMLTSKLFEDILNNPKNNFKIIQAIYKRQSEIRQQATNY